MELLNLHCLSKKKLTSFKTTSLQWTKLKQHVDIYPSKIWYALMQSDLINNQDFTVSDYILKILTDLEIGPLHRMGLDQQNLILLKSI